MNKLKNKNEKGITLIALVITIIVLLILAGVAINMAINSDGLFAKSKEAAEKWNTAAEKEETEMQGLLDKLEIDPPGVVSVQEVSLDTTDLTVVIGKTAQLTATIEPSEATNTNVTWSSSNEAVATVNENGVVTGVSTGEAEITVTTESKNRTATCSVRVTLPEGWDPEKLGSVVTQTSTVAGKEATRIVPIPKGFIASERNYQGQIENTVSNGLVIYQVPDGATVDWENLTITIGGETTSLRSTVNQYVWIPVDDINQMVMCKQNNKNGTGSIDDMCNIELEGENLICKTHDDSTDLCGRLYTRTEAKSESTSQAGNGAQVTFKYRYNYTMSFTDAERATQKWNTNGVVEPYFVGPDSSYASNYTEFQNTVKNDFKNMAISVEKYGGFYVARYEAGIDASGNLVSNLGSTILTDTNSNWYDLYDATNKTIALKDGTAKSHMIFGCQFDQIIKFIGTEAYTLTYQPSYKSTYSPYASNASNPASWSRNLCNLVGSKNEYTMAARGWDAMRLSFGGGSQMTSTSISTGVKLTQSDWALNTIWYQLPSQSTSYTGTRCCIYL